MKKRNDKKTNFLSLCFMVVWEKNGLSLFENINSSFN